MAYALSWILVAGGDSVMPPWVRAQFREVRPTQRGTKLADILDVIEAKLPPDGASGAVVYCATCSETQRVADFLK